MKRLVKILGKAGQLRRIVGGKVEFIAARLLAQTSGAVEHHAQSFLTVQPGVELEVYSKAVPNIGTGAAIRLLVHSHEVLRLDCFGRRDGHYHATLADYPETTKERV